MSSPFKPHPSLLYRSPVLFRWALSWFPPFWGSGIRVTEVAPDFSRVVVQMRDIRINRNAFACHFGGSLFAMTDPFYCLMLVARLGPDYAVWDQAATITFMQPGRGTVQAEFTWTDAQIAEIVQAATAGAKVLPQRQLSITDAQGAVVATVHKTLYVRKKMRAHQ